MKASQFTSIQGPATDIETGFPIEAVAENARKERELKEEYLLGLKAVFLGVSQSEAAQAMIAIVQKHLDRRIDDLVKNDPAASAYLAILADVGIMENEAEKAAKRLVKMKTQKNLP